MAAAGAALAAGITNAATLNVCLDVCTHKTVQSAVDAAASGDVIVVRPGRYVGNITITGKSLGIVGVNLLYGAFFKHHEPDTLVESLLDNLSTQRIEIDMIEFSGIEFRSVDNRVMSLKLVQLGLSGAAMFGAHGQVLQPAEVLHRRPVLVERGSFRPVTHVNMDMLSSANDAFTKSLEGTDSQGEPVQLLEITMRNLMASGEIDYRDFLARADMMAATGKIVLISDYSEYYRLAAYLTRYTAEPIAVTMGVTSLIELFTESYYKELEGGILEAFGRLFTKDLRLYVYPLRDHVTGQIKTVENVEIPGSLQHLFRHLVGRNRIKQLVAGLPPEHPARVLGEREVERLSKLARDGEERSELLDLPKMPSLAREG